MNSTFRGWIPAVSGRLSFGAFGDTSYPTYAITANATDGYQRFLVSYQARDTSDTTLPLPDKLGRYIAKLLWQVDGRIWFLCLARTEHGKQFTQEYLTGTVLLFHKKITWRLSIESNVKELQKLIHDFQYTGHGREEVLSGLDQIEKKFSHRSMFNCRFKVSRTGTTEITIDRDMSISTKSPLHNVDRQQSDHFLSRLSAQVFYFLRDIGHRHQHHDPSTDRIVDLYPIEGDDSDVQWRLHTLYSMYRRIIYIKRNPHSLTFSDSLGIIAYADTFQRISKEELGSDENLPTYYGKETSRSVEATRSKVFTGLQQKGDHSSKVQNVFLGLLTVAFSTLMLLGFSDAKIEANPYFVDVAQTIMYNPLITLIGGKAYPFSSGVVSIV